MSTDGRGTCVLRWLGALVVLHVSPDDAARLVGHCGEDVEVRGLLAPGQDARLPVVPVPLLGALDVPRLVREGAL